MTGDAHAGINFDVSGLDLSRMERAADVETRRRGLTKAGEHIRAAAAPLTPVDTGRLVGSAAVTVSPDADSVAITYDGPYARYQHERLDLRHEHGQAKYLEQPMATERDTALGLIAGEIRQTLRHGGA